MGDDVGDEPLSHREVTLYVLHLRNEFKRILQNDFGVQTIETNLRDETGEDTVENLTLNVTVLGEIVHSSAEAMHHLRNSYQHTISMLKYPSNVCYWIIRLKPVNCNFLMLRGR